MVNLLPQFKTGESISQRCWATLAAKGEEQSGQSDGLMTQKSRVRIQLDFFPLYLLSVVCFEDMLVVKKRKRIILSRQKDSNHDRRPNLKHQSLEPPSPPLPRSFFHSFVLLFVHDLDLYYIRFHYRDLDAKEPVG